MRTSAASRWAGPRRAATAGGEYGWWVLGRDLSVCVGAYLYGSLPLLYFLGRLRRVDLKQIGSGNVGATNLMEAGAPATAAAGWAFDASKGLAPVVVARRLGVSRGIAELSGVCGVAGQCWPVFLRLRGGRGISAYVGAASQLDVGAWSVALVPMIAGALWQAVSRVRHGSGKSDGHTRRRRGKSVPFGCLVSVVTFATLGSLRSRANGRSAAVPILLAFVVCVRRMTATLPDDAACGPRVRAAALWYRLLYDRNTSA
jgi:acyl-phosphate glycerol 3-phosphate acyltransferase